MPQRTPNHDEAAAIELGQKLGVLINALEVKEEVRDAVLAILPELTFAQLVELAAFLQTSAVQAETADLDLELRQEVERIKVEYDEAERKLNETAQAELAAVAAKLKP